MGPQDWWGHGVGFWWVFPLIGLVVFFLIMRTMFGGRGSMNCGSHGADSSPTESARNLLDKRFARGELTKDEYEEMRKTLSSGTR